MTIEEILNKLNHLDETLISFVEKQIDFIRKEQKSKSIFLIEKEIRTYLNFKFHDALNKEKLYQDDIIDFDSQDSRLRIIDSIKYSIQLEIINIIKPTEFIISSQIILDSLPIKDVTLELIEKRLKNCLQSTLLNTVRAKQKHTSIKMIHTLFTSHHSTSTIHL